MTNEVARRLRCPGGPVSSGKNLPGPLLCVVSHIDPAIDAAATTVLWGLLGLNSPDTMIWAAAMREQAL
ncbi:hypothetical protein LCGC14_0909300 [marine sediment metagenome]|uniref:Uncharacterized protein n=1 Tax=marine sediment metagenome TaxID=412755 RepID=A0A0F9S0W7_9ZZZZ